MQSRAPQSRGQEEGLLARAAGGSRGLPGDQNFPFPPLGDKDSSCLILRGCTFFKIISSLLCPCSRKDPSELTS